MLKTKNVSSKARSENTVYVDKVYKIIIVFNSNQNFHYPVDMIYLLSVFTA